MNILIWEYRDGYGWIDWLVACFVQETVKLADVTFSLGSGFY